MKALHETDFKGYLRPDHGRLIWNEKSRPGYGLFDRALGVSYLYGIWESLEKKQERMIIMKSNLKEKVAVITGGGGILCGTIAKGLAKEGVKIAILDISLDKARTVTDEILKEGGEML